MQHETENSNYVEEIAVDDKPREQIKACERNVKCDGHWLCENVFSD